MSATAFCFLLIHHIYRFAVDKCSEIFFNYSDEPRPCLESRPGDVRGYQAVFASEQRIAFFRRLGRENVNSRARYPARFQRVGECLLVNHGAARGVDEKCVRLHLRNKLGVYKPGCLRSQRTVESHKVRFFEQLINLNESDRPVAVSDFCGARIGEHIHAESPCDFATALPILP